MSPGKGKADSVDAGPYLLHSPSHLASHVQSSKQESPSTHDRLRNQVTLDVTDLYSLDLIFFFSQQQRKWVAFSTETCIWLPNIYMVISSRWCSSVQNFVILLQTSLSFNESVTHVLLPTSPHPQLCSPLVMGWSAMKVASSSLSCHSQK